MDSWDWSIKSRWRTENLLDLFMTWLLCPLLCSELPICFSGSRTKWGNNDPCQSWGLKPGGTSGQACENYSMSSLFWESFFFVSLELITSWFNNNSKRWKRRKGSKELTNILRRTLYDPIYDHINLLMKLFGSWLTQSRNGNKWRKERQWKGFQW